MTDFNSMVTKAPPETQNALRLVWDSLAPAERARIQSLITTFPTESNLIKMLVTLSASQVKLAFGQKHSVAIVGPTNVGKSTLYNQMVQSKTDLAVASPLPGTTRVNQQADAGLFTIIDTPGADAAGVTGLQERQIALAAAQKSDFLVIVFDAIQGIRRSELELFNLLLELDKPYIVILNKIDLVRKDKKAVLERAAANLGLKTEQVIPVAARYGENMHQVLMSIALTQPEITAALGQALPHYRWQLAWRSIVSSASISAAIALVPLPVIDFAPLILNQSVMVLGIARIYDYKITIQRARELAAAFGLGFLGRTLFLELSKLGGVPGWVLAAAIASSTTVVMGYAAAVWFEKGERLSADALKALTQNLTQQFLAKLKNLGKRKPKEITLQSSIADMLENSPIAQDQSAIHMPPKE